MDISSWIKNRAEIAPDRTAIRFGCRDISYAAFDDAIARLAYLLAGTYAIRPGDRVAYLGENSPELLQCLFACAKIGAIFTPLNSRMTVEQQLVFLRHFSPACMLAESRFQGTAEKCIAALAATPLVIFESSPEKPAGGFALGRGIQPAQYRQLPATGQDDDAAMMVYTSGTTGTPKGALLDNSTLFYSAMNAIRAFDITPWDEVLTIAPMTHVGGLIVHTLPALHAGATVTLHAGFNPAEVLRDIERLKITLLSARPILSRPLTGHADWDTTDLSSLRAVTSGSTRVTAEIMQPWFDRGIPVMQNYGLTEAIPPVIIVPRKDAGRKLSSIGKPVLHCQARIVDDNMRDVAVGQRGQIVLKGPSLFKSYWKNKKATRDAFRDGWFLTGDVGHVDEEGFFYVDDRIKDIVIVGSSNVYPADVERILAECDAIEEAAVVGQPDPEFGEAVVACVVLKKGYTISAEELKSLFEGRLAPYQHPRFVKFMDAIPYTLSGKVWKTELRQMLAT